MPSINMIAARRADKRRLQKNKQKLFYVILAEVGLVLVAVSIMTVKLVATGIESSNLTDKLAGLQDKVNQIQQLNTSIAGLQPKVTALDQASKNTMFWYSALQNVTASLPSSAWLTSVGTVGDASTAPAAADPASPGVDQFAKMNVLGQAASQFDVGTTMLRLNSYPNIDMVKLHQVSESTNGPAGVTFDMEVHLKPEAPLADAKGADNVQKS